MRNCCLRLRRRSGGTWVRWLNLSNPRQRYILRFWTLRYYTDMAQHKHYKDKPPKSSTLKITTKHTMILNISKTLIHLSTMTPSITIRLRTINKLLNRIFNLCSWGNVSQTFNCSCCRECICCGTWSLCFYGADCAVCHPVNCVPVGGAGGWGLDFGLLGGDLVCAEILSGELFLG